MGMDQNCGVLVLDRKGEYIEDTLDQRRNRVFGLHHHPNASSRMVVVSDRPRFEEMRQRGEIFDCHKPQFNIRDIDPIDLADFLAGMTPQQSDLIRDYAHRPGFYENLLAETQFGAVNKRNWYSQFPGLFTPTDKGKTLLKKFEDEAAIEQRQELKDDEYTQLVNHLGGTTAPVLERAAMRIKRFCMNPFFGNSGKGPEILAAPSCVNKILEHLEEGRIVFIDMRGRSDEDYTLVAALFARRLLTENKNRDDFDQIRACLVMEEAHNILGDREMEKGLGGGSVFVELAREGRSFKLGFVLVTQQPDPQSIAAQVAKTIDTFVAFNMPPGDAKHLGRLRSGFADLELVISNAPEFAGVAISSDGNSVAFQSGPVDDQFMRACAAGTIDELLVAHSDSETEEDFGSAEAEFEVSVEERLAGLMRQRRMSIQPVALETMRVWRNEVTGIEDSLESIHFGHPDTSPTA